MGQDGFEGFVSFVGSQAAVSERNSGEAHVVHRLAVMVCELGPGRTAAWAGLWHTPMQPNYVTCVLQQQYFFGHAPIVIHLHCRGKMQTFAKTVPTF
jgi:tRNA(Phe) wybutosine-synthesizing methylase Tyw3